MSKAVKQLLMDDLKRRLNGVQEALLVSIAGLNTEQTFKLRRDLRKQGISLLMVKNSLARRATEGTPLAIAFEQAEGSLAVVWGGEDIVALAKSIIKVAEDKTMQPFKAQGGVLDGGRLTSQQVKDVSNWPSRQEVLAKIVGQILGPGAQLLAQIKGPGGTLASQIKEKGKGEESAEESSPEAAAAT